jgi:hypothetical protein
MSNTPVGFFAVTPLRHFSGKMSGSRNAGWGLSLRETFQEFAAEYAFRKTWYVDGCGDGFDGVSVIKPKERAA